MADRPPPGVWAAFRAAAVDFYYHSLRLLAANVAWGGLVFGLLIVAVVGAPLLALVLSPLLAIPFAGIARLAALIVRGQEVVLSDAWHAWRAYAPSATAIGVAVVLLLIALFTNIRLGLAIGDIPGGVLLALSLWGLVVGWLLLLPTWLLRVDPSREAWSLRACLALGGYLLLANPGRVVLLGILQLVVLVIAGVLVAALLTFALGYLALVTAHAVLPAADRLTIALGPRLPALALPPGSDDENDDSPDHETDDDHAPGAPAH
jgi:hypothetical protein